MDDLESYQRNGEDLNRGEDICIAGVLTELSNTLFTDRTSHPILSTLEHTMQEPDEIKVTRAGFNKRMTFLWKGMHSLSNFACCIDGLTGTAK